MEKIKEILKGIPAVTGVYIFKNNEGVVLYVGKAIDLAKRVGSYFTRNNAIGLKTQTLRRQIAAIETRQTSSEFDALLLEASLIKKYVPKYNTNTKDDKSPLYVEISQDTLPFLHLVRRSHLNNQRYVVIGPFQSAYIAKALLASLRRIIPYCTQKQRNGRPCFYTHLGLCDPCPSVICKMEEGIGKRAVTKAYRKNINRLIRILSGKSRMVLGELQKDMYKAAKEEQFEKAEQLKKQVECLLTLLARHYDPVFYEDFTIAKTTKKELLELLTILRTYIPRLTPLHKIECIDISNLGGRYATGSLVALIDGVPTPSEYRRFRIRREMNANDTAMISEVVMRRIKHSEWAYPDLLVVDGGKGQLHAATMALATVASPFAVVGLAKRNEEIILIAEDAFKTLRLPLHGDAIHVVQRVRDEAHRFAKKYHVFLRSRSLRALPHARAHV